MTEREKQLIEMITALRKQLDRRREIVGTATIEVATRKTHAMIKSQSLRRAYAAELWQWRNVRKEGAEVWRGFQLGIESGFWAQQKAIGADLR